MFNQITIPSAVRSDLHVEPGDRVGFVNIAEGRYEVVAATGSDHYSYATWQAHVVKNHN